MNLLSSELLGNAEKALWVTAGLSVVLPLQKKQDDLNSEIPWILFYIWIGEKTKASETENNLNGW